MTRPYDVWIALGLLLITWPTGPSADERVPFGVVFRDKVILELRVMNAKLPPGVERPLRLPVDPDFGGTLEFDVLWPDDDSRCTLALHAEEVRGPVGDGRGIALSVELKLPDGTTSRAARNLVVRDFGTSLFEVYHRNNRSLTLAIDAEIVRETVVPGRRAVGGPVVLDLEIQRVVEGRVFPLERNQLSTFVGESVAYSFRLGDRGEADAVRITLKPVRVVGELITIDIDVSGTLPGENDVQLISKTESWTTTRGAVSSVAVESGDPPTGYRFLVTPRY